MKTKVYHNKKIDVIPVLNTYNNFQWNEINSSLDNVILFDSETTGLQTYGNDEMVQVCLMAKSIELLKNSYFDDIKQDEITKYYYLELFIKPDINTSKDALNAIYSNFVVAESFNKPDNPNPFHAKDQFQLITYAIKEGHSSKKVIEAIAEIINQKIVVMQNGINFDAILINKLANQHFISLDYAVLDTVSLANRLELPLKSFSQGYLGQYLNAINTNAHNAVGDTSQLTQIFNALRTNYHDEKIKELMKMYENNSVIYDFITVVTSCKNAVLNKKLYRYVFSSQILKQSENLSSHTIDLISDDMILKQFIKN